MEDSLRKIYEDHASLMHFLTQSGMSPPPALALAAAFAINASLRRALEAEHFDPAEIESLLARADADQITLDTSLLSYTAGLRMKRVPWSTPKQPWKHGISLAVLTSPPPSSSPTPFPTMPFEVNLWHAQNICNDLLRRTDKHYWSEEWKDGFKKLGLALNIDVDRLVIEEGVTAF